MENNYKEHIFKASTQIDRVAYLSEEKVLHIKFKNGGQYKYLDVPEEKYFALITAESAGKFLNAEIKPFHQYKKVIDEAQQ